MNFKLPMSMPSMPSMGGTAGLVIRTGAVEILAMKGRKVTSRVRVAVEGKDDGHLIAAIERARAAAGLKAKRLAVSMPSQDVLFRYFSVPTVPKAELDSVIQFEARKYIPFRIDSIVWSYAASSAKGSNQTEVVFSAVSRDVFRQLQDICISAGVHPSLVEPRSVSLARLIPASKSPKEFTCVVEVEEGAAHLSVVKDRVPYLTRDILFAQGAASETNPSGTANLGFPSQGVTVQADAQAPVEPVAEVPPPVEQAAAPVGGPDPRAERLLSELSVSINFFLREYPSTTIDHVILFGEETLVGPWCQWLTEQLRCPVELGSALVDSRVDGGLPLAFAPALGLLEAAKKPDAAPLDFLPRSTVKSAAAQPVPRSPQITGQGLLAAMKTAPGIASVVLAVCLLGGLWFLKSVAVAAERGMLDRLTASRPDIDAKINMLTAEQLTALKDSAQTQLDMLRELVGQRVSVAAKLDAMARALPDGVWLTSVAFDELPLPSGKSELRMTVRGACYLGQADQEMGAIHKFEETVRRDQRFLSGFSVAQVDQIDAQESQDAQPYRAFQLNCNPGRAL